VHPWTTDRIISRIIMEDFLVVLVLILVLVPILDHLDLTVMVTVVDMEDHREEGIVVVVGEEEGEVPVAGRGEDTILEITVKIIMADRIGSDEVDTDMDLDLDLTVMDTVVETTGEIMAPAVAVAGEISMGEILVRDLDLDGEDRSPAALVGRGVEAVRGVIAAGVRVGVTAAALPSLVEATVGIGSGIARLVDLGVVKGAVIAIVVPMMIREGQGVTPTAGVVIGVQVDPLDLNLVLVVEAPATAPVEANPSPSPIEKGVDPHHHHHDHPHHRKILPETKNKSNKMNSPKTNEQSLSHN